MSNCLIIAVYSSAGAVGEQSVFGDAAVVSLDGGAVVLQPALLQLGLYDRAQALFERLGQVDAQPARLVEQFGVDEQVDGALLRR